MSGVVAVPESGRAPGGAGTQETNAYLRYLGVSRKDLVDALLAPSASATDRDVALAKAEFGLRPLGYALLTEQGLPLDGAWGGKTAADFKGVGQLPMFLKYAGPSFEGLTELFATTEPNLGAQDGQIMDIDGSGIPTLAKMTGPMKGYFVRDDGEWKSFRQFPTFPSGWLWGNNNIATANALLEGSADAKALPCEGYGLRSTRAKLGRCPTRRACPCSHGTHWVTRRAWRSTR